MVSNTQEVCIGLLDRIKEFTPEVTPTQSLEFGATKGFAAPMEAMYIHLESSAQAVAAFPLPSLAINHTTFVQREGWKVKVSPSHRTLPTPGRLFGPTRPPVTNILPNF
jgi:hypothetical protein